MYAHYAVCHLTRVISCDFNASNLFFSVWEDVYFVIYWASEYTQPHWGEKPFLWLLEQTQACSVLPVSRIIHNRRSDGLRKAGQLWPTIYFDLTMTIFLMMPWIYCKSKFTTLFFLFTTCFSLSTVSEETLTPPSCASLIVCNGWTCVSLATPRCSPDGSEVLPPQQQRPQQRHSTDGVEM